MRAVELLLLAGALLGALAVAVRRRRRAGGLPAVAERLLEAVPGPFGDAVVVLDGDGRITRANAAAALLAAVAPADLVGRPLAALGSDLAVLAKGLARGPVTALVSVAARGGPRRARAALVRVAPGVDVVALRPEPPVRPPPLPRRSAPTAAAAPPLDRAAGPAAHPAGLAAHPDGLAAGLAAHPDGLAAPAAAFAAAAAAAAAREPIARAGRAASILRLAAPPLGARAGAALAELEAALADAEQRVAALAGVGRPAARRRVDLGALAAEVIAAQRGPGLRLRTGPGPAVAHADDRALRAALREVLRCLAAGLAAGEEVGLAVAGEPEAAIELSAGGTPPPEVGAVARALFGAQGARVDEDAPDGRGWRLRIALPRATPAPSAESGAAFV